jgi:protein-S-isoprenylcysteine O-methyltransferase Ste14
MKKHSKIIIKIPPPVVTLVFSVFMYLLDSLVTIKFTGFWLNGLIILFLCLAAFLLLPAVVLFYKSKTTVNPLKPETAKVLVVEGVYRYSRNPMYLGMAFILIAWGIFLANPLNVFIFFCFIYYMNNFQIKVEEKALEVIFGENFKMYMQKVRRWI